MTISFGKFIPVKVYIDGKEIKTPAGGNVPKEVERATLTMCDCLTKDKNYPDTELAEQQRRFFSLGVDDYRIPRKSPKNKTDILPSTVKTANIEGQRYLVTGSDILTYKEQGHQLGIKRKEMLERAEDAIGSEAEGMSKKQFDQAIMEMTGLENQILGQDRINIIKQHMRRNDRVLDKTLYINAVTNPDAKLQRDKYKITLIDFKA